PDDPLQFIDARDLAEWMVRSSAADLGGTFNVTGSEMSFRSLLESCRRVTAAECQTVWIRSDKLPEAGVDPWMGVPLWIAAPGWEGANRVDISRAMANGLTLRPLDEVVGATWAWDQQRRHAGEAPDMLPPEQEAEIFERVRQTEQPVTQG